MPDAPLPIIDCHGDLSDGAIDALAALLLSLVERDLERQAVEQPEHQS